MSVTHRPLDNEASELKLELFCKLRETKRLSVAIPLKVNFLSSGRTAHVCTLDISPKGARLHSAGHQFCPGDVIVVQRRIERAHARVVWVGDATSAKGQVGIECPELEKFFWLEERLAAAKALARLHISFRFRR